MKEKFAIKVAWILPKRIVYWCVIRLIANATQGTFSGQVVSDLTLLDALKRWQNPPC